ncbi:hypothetical protein ABVT39_027022, partial [Epinephelus coioides]
MLSLRLLLLTRSTQKQDSKPETCGLVKSTLARQFPLVFISTWSENSVTSLSVFSRPEKHFDSILSFRLLLLTRSTQKQISKQETCGLVKSALANHFPLVFISTRSENSVTSLSVFSKTKKHFDCMLSLRLLLLTRSTQKQISKPETYGLVKSALAKQFPLVFISTWSENSVTSLSVFSSPGKHFDSMLSLRLLLLTRSTQKQDSKPETCGLVKSTLARQFPLVFISTWSENIRFGLLWPLLGYFGTFCANFIHFGLFCSVLGYFHPFWATFVHFVQLSTVSGYFRPFWATLVCFGLLSPLLGYFRPFWPTVIRFGLLSSVLGYFRPFWATLVSFGLLSSVLGYLRYFHPFWATFIRFGQPSSVLGNFGQFWATFIRFGLPSLLSSVLGYFHPFWATVATFGLLSSVLGYLGYFHPFWATFIHFRLLSSVLGNFGQFSATFIRFGLLWSVFGYFHLFWATFIRFGQLSSVLGNFGQFWATFFRFGLL